MRTFVTKLMWHVVPHRLIEWVHAIWLGLLDIAPAIVGGIPSHRLRIFLYRALGASIGEHTSIHRGCRCYHLPGLTIASNSVINPNVILDARRGLSIGRNVSISEQAAVYTLQHDLDDPTFALAGGPVVINDYVFIGARAVILPAVCLGEGAAIAAGAVVTKDVPAYTVAAGIPARPIRQRTHDLDYVLDYRRMFY